MPADLTIFAAKYLVFIEAALALAMLGYIFRRGPRQAILRWGLTAAVILILSYVFARIGAAAYADPRPFTEDHVRPLIAHAADNGFPSDHALLAAALVAMVAIANLRMALPLTIFAVLVDWARVGAGIHHVADVIGSTAFVALATIIAVLVCPHVYDWLSARQPTKGSPVNSTRMSSTCQ